jgi:hypothetical protein
MCSSLAGLEVLCVFFYFSCPCSKIVEIYKYNMRECLFKKQKNRKRLYVSNLGMKTAGKNTSIRVWNTGSKYMGLGINHS